MLLVNTFLFLLSIGSISPNAVASPTDLNSTLQTNSKPFSLGINCRGNVWCPWISRPSNRILTYLLDWIDSSVNDEDIYYNRVHIACVDLYAPTGVDGAAFCLFTQGRTVPPTGINGSEIKRKLTQLSEHGCFACGSVPLAEDNDPNAMGILTLNYVLERDCKPASDQKSPICKPSISAPTGAPKPYDSTLSLPASQVFNLTDMDSPAGAATAQRGDR